ncbi:MAG: hypothetical protein LAN84_00220 [Acidobacteriia bacterium]|nr:hypothetical protein [Terriglobia bacterium]
MPTNFTLGNDLSGQRILLNPANWSSDVSSGASQSAVLGLKVSQGPAYASFSFRTETSAQPVASAHHAVSGVRQELFGGQLFEKIIVIPRVKALGFVLSDTQFGVEVWNSFRDSHQTLQAINIGGDGGLTVANPYGLPLLFPALDSFTYQATVPRFGTAQIAQDVVFVFVSGIGGADMQVTGARITLFSIAPDWNEGMEETFEFLTDVLRAYSDNEQRRGLRQLPRRAMRYRALTLNARDAAGMESLIWGWQNQPYGVPWWPDAQPLLSDVAIGTFVIPVDTADRQFAVGGLLAIWVDEYTFEALNITAVAAHSVTCSSPTQFAWKAGPGTRVMPVFLCRLPASVDISRHSSEIDQVDLNFIGEAGQAAPAPTTSPAQFKGYDVLEIAPNWEKTPLKRSYKRSLVTIDPKVGPIQVIDKGGTAVVGQEFPWWLDTHPNVTIFRAFMLRRFGQLTPFWTPTWDQDLVLFQDVLSTDSGIRIKSEFYTRFFFPTPARRFVAFIPVDGSGNVYGKITAAADNGDGTETLTLETPTGKNFAKGSTMVSFLTLARLASDSIAIRWDSSEHAESILELQEVPRELP